MKKKELYITIGLIIISATLYSIIAFLISLSMSSNITSNIIFIYPIMCFLSGLLFFGLPISIISIIIDIVKTYKSNIERKARDGIKTSETPEEQITQEMKYCSSCGEKIKKQATYCEFCGTAQ